MITSAGGALSFDLLRPWEGSVSRAFEELAFQLLRDDVPNGTRAIRTGNPDGGVEWYVELSDQSEWGWQAKHTHSIESLLTGMTDSVRRVCKERKQLVKLTFVISMNLSTGTSGSKRKSQRQRYDDAVASWKSSIQGASKIDFELVQASDLLAQLSLTEHKGRVWFWWGDVSLKSQWLRDRYDEQAGAATEKYRPDLQVDLPIQQDLVALGLGTGAAEEFAELQRRIRAALSEVRFEFPQEAVAAEHYRLLADAIRELRKFLLMPVEPDPRVLKSALMPLSDVLTKFDMARSGAVRAEYDIQYDLEDQQFEKGQRPEAPRIARTYQLNELDAAVAELNRWLDSSKGRAFRGQPYFLVGQAGSGKTHLFLDAVKSALDHKRAAVFLAGAQFGHGNLWESMADQLGLENVGGERLLQAMDSAGEAGSLTGSRFIIFIDAINETPDGQFWRTHLPRLRTAVAKYDHVALAVSCRDTYRDLVSEPAERKNWNQRKHPGFQGREVEATQRYFEHYKLEAPTIPLLTPEFALPLFLRLYCEALVGTGASLTTGHQGRVSIFRKYLEAKVGSVARRLFPSASSDFELDQACKLVHRVLDVLIDHFASTGSEGLSAEVAIHVVDGETSSQVSASRLLGLLQDEGVLTREILYLGAQGRVDGIRIVFQAFADFLILQRRTQQLDGPLTDPRFHSWLRDESSWGVLEAATVLLPEVYGVELIDLLGEADEERTSGGGMDGFGRAAECRRLLLKTLAYRDSGSVTDRTIELLNVCLQYVSLREFYQAMFQVAPQTENMANADRLHAHLKRLSMPKRDELFGQAVYYELSDGDTPAARLARWASQGPYNNYDPKVIELAAIPLCWLLSSPNRPMRDWTTKALVQLLRGHLDVATALVRRFWTVDDPYIVQRVVVIAYGSLLKSSPANSELARSLVRTVVSLVFERPMRPDELLLDAARGVARWGAAHGYLTSEEEAKTARPYGLVKPRAPFTEKVLDVKYPWRSTESKSLDYVSIHASVLGMGDFGNYVVESGLRNFTRIPIGDELPPDPPREPRFVKLRWRRFIASLSSEQKALVLNTGRTPEDIAASMRRFYLRRSVDASMLSQEQYDLVRECFVYPKVVSSDYDTQAGRRWVFQRTISLGWTPEAFEMFDRSIGRGSGREGHKAERFGKKYEWMAYHELLARVADNFRWNARWNDDQSFMGLHQLIGDREIDPTLPPLPFESFLSLDSEAQGWGETPIKFDMWPPARVNFRPYAGDARAFVEDMGSEPSFESLIKIKSSDGEEWVVLSGDFVQSDPSHPVSWRGLRQGAWVGTVLTASDDAARCVTAAAEDGDRGLRDWLDSNGHVDCCYIGEVGRVAPQCPHQHRELASDEYQPIPVVLPAEGYTWEGSIYDASINATVKCLLPSTYIQGEEPLTFDVDGPCWRDEREVIQFIHHAPPGDRGSALLVRASYLRSFMAARNLSLVGLLAYDRMEITGGFGRVRTPSMRCSLVGRLDSDLKVADDLQVVRESYGPEED